MSGEATGMRANAAPAAGRPEGTPQPVTVAISRHVKPGRVAEYDAWLHEVTALASRWPGYHGSTVLRPRHGGERPEYTTVLHFDTEEHLTAWMQAPARHAMLARVMEFADEATSETVFEPGMEDRFTPHDAITPMRPPPRWKMVVVLTTVVFVMLNLLRLLFTPLRDADVPLPVIQVLSALVQVVALTYFIMPWLTKRLASWLQA